METLSEDIEYDIYKKKQIYIIWEISPLDFVPVPMRHFTVPNHVIRVVIPSIQMNVINCDFYHPDFFTIQILIM